MSPDLVWAAVTVLVLFLETVGILGRKPDDTISEMTRKHFHTDTPAGALIFGVAWVGFAGWYLWHIIWQHPSRRFNHKH